MTASHAPTPTSPPLPRTAQQRLDLAKRAGYLTTSGYVGLSRWLDDCALYQLPFVLVIKDRRRWRVSVELHAHSRSLRWAFTPAGEQVLWHIAAEHDATNIMSGPEYFRATKLDQFAAEQIAASVIRWCRIALANQQALSVAGDGEE